MANRFRSSFFVTLFVLCCATFLAVAVVESADSVVSPGGKGSYAVAVPSPGVKPNGSNVILTPPAIAPNVDTQAGGRRTPTSDWWTPLAWIDPNDLPDVQQIPSMTGLSWNVFSEPLVFEPQKGGLAVSLNIPDSRRGGDRNGTLTAGAGFMLQVVGDADHGGKGISPYFNTFFDQDMYLGSTVSGWNDAAYDSVKVNSWSDWFVNFTLSSSSKNENMRVTAGSGSPFLLAKLNTGLPQVTFRTWNVGRVVPLEGDSFDLNAGQAKAQIISATAFAVINKIPYGAPSAYDTYTVYAVFGPKGSTWTLNDTQYNAERRGPFPIWEANKAYAPGNPVEPSAAKANGFYYTANAAGTSGASEPAWPAEAGTTVEDGTITWTANPLEGKNVLNTATCSAGKYYAVAILPYPWGKSIYDEPDEALVKKLLAHFAEYAFAEVTDTRVTPKYASSADDSDVSVTYSYTATPVVNAGLSVSEVTASDAPLRAMHPHQYVGQPDIMILDQDMQQTSASSRTQGWYWPSLKGPMMLASGHEFVNTLEVPPCLPALVDSPEKDKADRMAAYIKQAYDSRDKDFLSQGSYFGAQQMHRLAMLLPVAEMIRGAASDPAAVDAAAKDIYVFLTEAMGDWLRATRNDGTAKNAAERLFYYESRWGSMIPTPEDGFAADSLLNDHHYHYGYFIKIATEIARWEKAHPDTPANVKWAEDYAPMVRLLIGDIANTSRTGTGTEPDFPYLRHFSPYVGHSWASGASRGNQGGQQESTPEAIQAWASILLWSKLNYPVNAGNDDLKRWAAYMFASEARAANMYWFGYTEDAAFMPYLSFRQYKTESDQVPLPYVPSIVSQVNQNEMTYQTNFGNAPLLKLGIQVLPLTGSSLYLGDHQGAPSQVIGDFLANDLPKLGDGGTAPSNKDKLLMYQALSSNYEADPKALIAADAQGVSPLDSWNMQWELPTPTYDNLILQDASRASIYWWISTILKHGAPHHSLNDASHSSAASFKKDDGTIAYTVYNPHGTALEVTFADGTVVEAPPMGYAHTTSAAPGGAGGSGCSVGAARPEFFLLLLAGLLLFVRR